MLLQLLNIPVVACTKCGVRAFGGDGVESAGADVLPLWRSVALQAREKVG